LNFILQFLARLQINAYFNQSREPYNFVLEFVDQNIGNRRKWWLKFYEDYQFCLCSQLSIKLTLNMVNFVWEIVCSEFKLLLGTK